MPEKDLSSQKARCLVCPHACVLSEGQVGICGARQAYKGRVIDQNYGRLTSLALDPIEKKPLARYKRGSQILSIGSYGCNMRCMFCQNASIACARQESVPWWQSTPEKIAAMAQSFTEKGNIGVAYTYNEPLVGYEFVRDTAQCVHDAGLVNVLVSNGMINAHPLSELVPLIDAANIDLKGFSDSFYRWAGGDFETVKHTIATLANTSTCHLEVTTLIIPGINDDPLLMDEMASWLAALNPNIPYHITRFFPCHKLTDRAPTEIALINQLVEIAREHLKFVFPGNC